MRKHLLGFILAISLMAPSAALSQTVRITPAERKTAEAITAAQISSYLHFIASDAMGGRDTPSQGLDITAEFLKMNLQKWGFKPAGDNGTFFQKMALSRESLDPAQTTLEINGQKYIFGDDFYRVAGKGEANGPIVFAGDGWLVKSKGIDAYAGVDVAGKVVVISSPTFNQQTLTARPAGVTNDDLKGQIGVDWANPVQYAKAKGAAGLVLIAPPQLQAMWPQLRNFLGRGRMVVDKLAPAPADGVADPPLFIVTEKVGDAIFAGEAGGRASDKAFETKKAARLMSAGMTEKFSTQNVVAIWEGSDPVLKKEMVAVGAHYDHVGTNPNAPGEDKIWNGADDDGSGTTAVLAIAEALAMSKVRPKRSVLLVWHAGEEKGLWGAEYFNKFPTVDIKNVIAQLNIDMIGRSQDPNNIIKCERPNMRCNEDLSKPNEIYVIGSEMMSSTLGAITKGTNAAYLKMDYNYKYDDPKDPNRFFFRSDHFHYALNGIPVAFWFDGVHEDYHQPTDHPDKIDYQKMEKVTRTIFLTMWELADLKERPKVDKQLPPELTQR